METEANSTSGLIRSVLDDARELIREELAVARAEIREEVSAVRTVGMAFGAAAGAGIVAAVLLSVAFGGAIADVFDWPTWAGYGVVALLLGVGAYFFARYGQGQLANIKALPKTMATFQENMVWIQGKSTQGSSKNR